MAESLTDIQSAFRSFLNDQIGVLFFSLNGIELACKNYQRLFADADADPDKFFLLGDGPPGSDTAVGYQRWRIGDLSSNLSECGLIGIALGHQWLVSVYAHWEHEFRPRFSRAIGQEVNIPMLGDLRLIRNDVLHNKGVASNRVMKCQELRWFSPDDRIIITSAHAKELMKKLDLTFKP